MRKKLTAALCLALVFILAFTGTVNAATQAELQAQIEKNNAQIAANQEKLNELKGQKANQQAYLEALEGQIKAVEEKATNLQSQVDDIDAHINELKSELIQLKNETDAITVEIKKAEKAIVATENDIAEKSFSLSMKLRSSYMKGSESTLKILMGSDSLASFMTRLEFMKRSSERDKQTILDFRDKVVNLKETKAELEEDKKILAEKEAEISEKKKEQEDNKQALVEKQKEYDSTMDNLESQYSEVETVMENIDKSSAAYQNYINKLKAENEAADAEIDRILKEYYANQQTNTQTTAPSGNSYNSNDTWLWPLGSTWCYISSKYGNRNANISGWSFHGGIDIAGGNGRLHGAPVYATRAGTVITAVTSNSGYGIYVLIDHGDGYSSLYAHMSARYVNVGDTVSKGQMIGRVGNTGNSRGAHLHFEIRYYGEKKNPLNYVSNPN